MKNEEKIQKKNKNKKVLIIIGSILLLVILFLLWFFNRKFDVTFKINDSDEYVVKVKYNHKIKEEDIKTKEDLGDDFIDWYEVISTEKDKEVLAEDSFDFTTKIKAPLELRAIYNGIVETITITYDSKGGSKVDSSTINKGDELTLPSNPTRSGYAFKGWTLENGNSVKNNTVFEEDTTLYAKWEKITQKITISFDTNGGSKISNVDINKGSTLSFPAEPTKNGYKFKGWTLKNGNSVNTSTKFNENTTLYASWEKVIENVTISFDTDGGNKINDITTTKGSSIKFPTNPTKDGYDFKGWTLKNGSSVNESTKFNENTTLYASWTKKEEKISLSLSRNVIHRDGYNTSKAIAKVENTNDSVTYSTNNATCITIDKTTGEIKADPVPTSGTKAKYWRERCAYESSNITITATLPSGKSASATLTLEADLTISPSYGSIIDAETLYVTDTGKLYPADSNKRFTINANQVVTWSTSVNSSYTDCVPVSVTSTSKSFTSALNASCADGNSRNTYVTATTAANQQIKVQYQQALN